MIALGISGGPEVRESYTDFRIAGLENLAVGGGSRRTAWLSSAVAELAAGQWSRVLSLAAVTPASAAAVVTPDVLATIGRRLARDGESVHVLRFRGGRLRFTEAAHVDVTGGPDPEDWIYWASLYGPSQTERVRLTAAAVLHCRYGWYVHRPWVGVAPGDWAAGGSGLVGGLDTMLASEALAPSAYVLELPNDGGEHPVDGEDATDTNPDPTAKLRADMAAARGAVTAMQALRSDSDPLGDPRQVGQYRLGMDPPQELKWIQSEAGSRMLAAYGLHPSLIAGNVNGQVLRESWRSFLALTARPLARRIEAELTRVLEVPVGLDLAPARAGDVGTLARAVGTLVHNGGLSVDRAMQVVGLEEDTA